MITRVHSARPLHLSVATRLIGSAANYWLALVGDVVIAGAFLVLGVRLFSGSGVEAVVAAVAGFVAWGGIEYGVHRWVFHGPPSLARRAHARHHADGTALISAPVFVSAAMAAGMFAILSVLLPPGHAAFVVFGLYAGYNHYAVLHHLLHRRRSLVSRVPFLARLEQAHHFHHVHGAANYGVSTSWWDHLLGSYQPSDDSGRSRNRRTTHA